MTAAVGAAPAGAGARWRDVVALFKLRIDVLVVAVAVTAALAAGVSSVATLLVLASACLAASAGASALNQVFERDLDARMRRTRSRPLAAGRLDPRVASVLGWGLVGASQASALVLGAGAALYLLAGALTYAVVYTRVLKPRTPYSIVLGGASGSFAALAGWQAGASTATPAAVLLAAVLFCWTPSHFWSLAIVLERDYREAGLPMLSARAGARRTAAAVVANTVALVVASLALGAFLPWPYLAVAVPAGAGFLGLTLWLLLSPEPARAFIVFKLSGAYLLVLLAGVVLATVP
jgi:protoheme IX farnesyltransferase